MITREFVSSFNLKEYAKLLVAMPMLGRNCRACYTFITQTKCHGLTNGGKQCSLTPSHMLDGGLQLCGNHFNKKVLLHVYNDMPLMRESAPVSIETPNEPLVEFQPDVYQHIEEYGKIASELVPWNDSIKQMGKEFHKFSMKCKETMPPHMFAHDEALGSIGCDVSVALKFLIFLRWPCYVSSKLIISALIRELQTLMESNWDSNFMLSFEFLESDA